MTGDFSRPYDVLADDNFSGVLYQQGRVFLDTDGNAQTRITNSWQDTAGLDVIGAGVAAVPAGLPDSFKIDAASIAGNEVTITVLPGRVWADGMLVKLEETPPINRTADYLLPPVQNPPWDVNSIANGVRDAVILEVWREAMNGFQLPDLLIEPALGGPDTTERVHTAFDFRLLRLEAGDSCDNLEDKLDDDFANKGKLTVTLQPPVNIPGDCPIVEGGGYTGFEHNLYRIEIAETGGGPVAFKWSQFNGGLVGRGLFDAATHRVTIKANLQAIITSGLTQFYLETREYDAARGRWRVTYGAPVTLNNDNELVLPNAATFGAIPAAGTQVFFRLWNDIRPVTDFPVGPNPVELQDGIMLQFEANAVGKYVSEDFWTFVVRAGEISNPQTLINAAPPEGIHFHRVPLAILNWDGSQDLTSAEGTIDDCRHPFQSLTRLSTCCTYRVGDGLHSYGDFESIQDAVNHLPSSGGQICVLPGVYTENVLVDAKSNIIISGCGDRTRVVSAGATNNQPDRAVFHVKDSHNIAIEHLAVDAHDTGIGIFLEGTVGQLNGGGIDTGDPGLQRGVHLVDLFMTAAGRSAIEARGGAEIFIRDCNIEMEDVRSSWAAIFFMGEDGWIEHNVIHVRPNVEALSEGTPIPNGAGFGGIHIGGTSERVHIVENLIQGGIGNGITLGSIIVVSDGGDDTGAVVGWPINPDDPCFPCLPGDTRLPDPQDGGAGGTREVSAGPLRDIYIEHNRILDMGLNGIGVVSFFNLEVADEFITVERLTIHGNEIRRCLQRDLAPIEAAMIDSMGYGGMALADVEHLVVRENIIEDNGPNYLEPICGIFVLHGEGIDISSNRIVNNGAKTGEPPNTAEEGRRGGINIVYCVAPTTMIEVADLEARAQNGVPALKVHDNIVSAPLGQALRVTAIGPVSVQGNQFTTQDTMRGREGVSPTFIAATVLIVNLGVSNELWLQLFLFNAIREGQGGATPGEMGDDEVVLLPREGLDDLRIGQYLGNGNVLFNDNQVSLDLLETGGTFSISSILILSLDDISFVSNQCDSNLRDDFLISQAILGGISLRVTDNRFKEGLINAIFSAITFGIMNTTADNQSTHCLLVRGWKQLPSPPGWSGEVNHSNTILLEAFVRNVCGRFDRVLDDFGRMAVTGGQ